MLLKWGGSLGTTWSRMKSIPLFLQVLEGCISSPLLEPPQCFALFSETLVWSKRMGLLNRRNTEQLGLGWITGCSRKGNLEYSECWMLATNDTRKSIRKLKPGSYWKGHSDLFFWQKLAHSHRSKHYYALCATSSLRWRRLNQTCWLEGLLSSKINDECWWKEREGSPKVWPHWWDERQSRSARHVIRIWDRDGTCREREEEMVGAWCHFIKFFPGTRWQRSGEEKHGRGGECRV